MRNKKILSMLLAVVISLGIWLYVVLVENPEKTAISALSSTAEDSSDTS